MDARNALGVDLFFASQDNNIPDVCKFINRGADVNYVIHQGRESATPLTMAAQSGHVDAV